MFPLQISEDHEQLSEYIKKLLEVMEYDIPYTSKALMEKLGLKSKEGFRRKYLRPAVDMNLDLYDDYQRNLTAETKAALKINFTNF